jgi:glutathione S-transferase
MLKLFYVPGACSLCTHIILHEAGVGFELEKVNPRDKTTDAGRDYNAINPKGYVPALLLDDGQLLTEVAVVVQYLADLVPERKLAPPAGTLERYRLQEWLNYIATEIHKGFGPLFNKKLAEDARAAGKERLALRIGFAARALEGRDYLLGNAFTVADAYLFTALRWADYVGLDLSLWPALKDYRDRIAARPSVQAALKAEGLATAG